MKPLKPLALFLFFLGSSPLFSQHVYPEVIDNCYLDQFVFEKDHLLAKLDNNKIIEAVTGNWDEKMKKSATGVLGLQILVDNRGSSCLMSVRNDTNLKTKKMNLAQSINDNLKWPRMQQKVSAIVVLLFKDGEIEIKRMGTVDNQNLIEIDN